jgi:23S rRNA maturation mini-RNase III
MGNDDLTPIAVLPPALLERRAIVYVRQSTQSQVMTNLESAHSDTSDQVFRRHMISHSGVSDHPEMTPSGAVW